MKAVQLQVGMCKCEWVTWDCTFNITSKGGYMPEEVTQHIALPLGDRAM